MAAIKGVNRSFTQRGHYRTKGGTDHNADCQIYDIAAKQELFETVHISSTLSKLVLYSLPAI